MNYERLLAQKLLDMMHQVRRRMDAELRHLTQERQIEPAHFPVLMSLRRRTYNVSELADRLEVSLPSMSKTVTAVVNRGWVERVRSEEDRRVVQLYLTDEGRAMLRVMREQADHVVARMLAPLSAGEREQLSAGLDALYRALGETFQPAPPAPQQANDPKE
jgi:DNA-binding MarR family transcriptional regulator